VTIASPAPSLAWIAPALVAPCSGQPRGQQGWVLDGGVFAPDGTPVAEARHRGEPVAPALPAPLRRDDLPIRPGTWLFGGWLQPHFGHVVLYGLGRLWAFAELRQSLAGVVFLRLPDRRIADPRHDPLRLPHVRDMLACLGIGAEVPCETITAPTRFAQLAVPRQLLFGAGHPADDNAAFLAMLRRMAESPRVPRDPRPPRLYVSRRRLDGRAGGLMFEELIEENLAAEGYAVIHPERLPIAEQVAAYAAVREVVFAEGSALHLAVGFLGAEDAAAIICRRPARSPRPGDLLSARLGRALLVDAVLGGVVSMPGETVTEHATVGARALLDLRRVRDALAHGGFCRGEGWQLPSEEDVAARIAAEIAARRAAVPDGVVRYATREEMLRARLARAASLTSPG
jgi:hypothetical protein